MVTQAIGSFVILPMVDVDPKANCTLFHLIKVVNSDFSPRHESFYLITILKKHKFLLG